MTAVDAVEVQAQAEQDEEPGGCAENDPMCTGRHEAHEIARIGFQEAQIGGKHRLIADDDLEMFDDRDDNRDRQINRRGDPEPVADHEQDQVDDAAYQQIQHGDEIQIRPHLGDETPTDGRAGQFDAGRRGDAPFEHAHADGVEYDEQDAVQPAWERFPGAFQCDLRFLVFHTLLFVRIEYSAINASCFGVAVDLLTFFFLFSPAFSQRSAWAPTTPAPMRISHSSFTVFHLVAAIRAQAEHLDGVAFDGEPVLFRNAAKPALPRGFDLHGTAAPGAHHVVMVRVIPA